MNIEPTSTAPVGRIVMPFASIHCELMLRQTSNSYTIADGWTIAWVGDGWQVYHKGLDATVRLHVGAGRAGDIAGVTFASFQIAWEWVADLTPWEIEMITVTSI